MIKLGGVALSKHMVWSDRFSTSPVAQTSLRTLGGAVHVYSQALSKGVPITLEATADTGWITYEMVQQVRALYEVPGAQYVFDFFGEQHNVIFRHDEPPAFLAQPLVYATQPQPGDYFTATIRLLTV